MESSLKNVSVGIIGTGTMGKGIVQLLLQSDVISTIFWKGRNLARTQNASMELERSMERLVAKKRLDSDILTSYHARLKLSEEFTDFTAIDLILEVVSEDINEKRQVFTEVAQIASESVILASNTSSLSITELASLTKHPENVVGLHLFNPAPIMKLAEIISGFMTSESTISWAKSFARALGKDPVHVNEAPGFIVNRMLIPMINEAVGVLAEGVANAEDIDKAMRLGANHPIGPLALADLIGNDVNLSIMETLYRETGDPKYRAHPLLRKMVRANRLGRKTGVGFFKY